jgi:hypothetical protein
VYNAAQVVEVARQAGFLDGPGTYEAHGLTWAVAVAFAESAGRVDAVGGPNRDGSYDYGLWQINGKAHPSYDPGRLRSEAAYNAAAAFAISSNGGSFAPWSTIANGAAMAHYSQAAAAVGGQATNDPLPCLGSSQGAGDFHPPDSNGDKGDGGTGCGWDWNIVHALGCVLRWAFVPSPQSIDFSAQRSAFSLTVAGQWVGSITAFPGAFADWITSTGDPVRVSAGGTTTTVLTSTRPDSIPPSFALGVRALLALLMWAGVALRVMRTLPWAHGRDDGAPVT